MNAFILSFFCCLMISGGQVLWKIAIDKNGGFFNYNISISRNIITLFLSPYMISGLLLYSLATLLWMYLLSKYEYSFLYPMLSLTYIIAFIFAILIFNEKINIYRWIGIGFIILGIIFINKR